MMEEEIDPTANILNRYKKKSEELLTQLEQGTLNNNRSKKYDIHEP